MAVRGPKPANAPKARDWAHYAGTVGRFEAIPAEVRHGGARAFYIPSADRIELLEPDGFQRPRAYFFDSGQ
jgi:antirestriction protein ArdC